VSTLRDIAQQRAAKTALNPEWTRSADRRNVAGSMRRLLSGREEHDWLTRCRRSSCGAALSQPEYRSSADPGSHANKQSDRADDVAVVPADAYEYRHLLSVAQPW